MGDGKARLAFFNNDVFVYNEELAKYSYTSQNNYLAALDYGNGDKVKYTYDRYGRLTAQTYEDGATISYAYDNDSAQMHIMSMCWMQLLKLLRMHQTKRHFWPGLKH